MSRAQPKEKLNFSPLYIPERGLSNLKNNPYSYRCVDKSLVAAYIMQPFWTFCAELLPIWMAPNVVTLLGFFFILLSFCVSIWYNPTFEGRMPEWVYLLNAVCLFLYQLFDALDGKQARKTKTSSPLGELFDHGCDVMTSVFSALTVYATIRSGLGWFPLINLAIMMSTFYCAQWEVYFTETLHLWYINVTEAQFFGILTHFVAFLFGADWWITSFSLAGFQLHYYDLLIFGSASGTTILMVINIRNIFLTPANQKGYDKAPMYLLPNIWIGVSTFYFAYLTQNVWLKDAWMSMILHFAMGFLYANAISKLCTARVCGLDYDLVQVLFVVPAVCILAKLTGLASVSVLMYSFCFCTVAGYAMFSYGLIHDMTHLLDIYAFSIKYPVVQSK